MFDFLSKLFGKKQSSEQKAEKTDIAGLIRILNEEKRKAEEHFVMRLEDCNAELRHALKELSSSITLLRNARLINPNIPERAKQFAEGNREAFARAAERLIQGLDFPSAPFQTAIFFKEMDKRLADFASASSRPYHLLQEFFANESRAVMEKVALLEKNANLLKQAFVASRLEEIDKLILEAEELQSRTKNISLLKNELEAAKSRARELEGTFFKLKEALSEAEGDLVLFELTSSLERTRRESASLESAIRASFTPLEAALKKYAKISFEHNVLVAKYLEDPVQALSQDIELKILNALERLRDLLEKDQLELKERKKERCLQAISKLNKEFLETFVKKYAMLKRDEEALLSKIHASEAFARLKRLRTELVSTEEKLISAKVAVEQLEKKTMQAEFERLKAELAQKASSLLGRQVIVV
ncbi:MAG: hypothetical protein QXU88_02535 [Candidatus Woesearchaeota archaeon]